jgi:nucleoside-diphosphate-sugar epimerase
MMKVVVIGGTGLIGSKVVSKLDQHGHQAVAACAQGNPTRRVVTDAQSRYFGVVLDDHTLVPATAATVFATRFRGLAHRQRRHPRSGTTAARNVIEESDHDQYLCTQHFRSGQGSRSAVCP